MAPFTRIAVAVAAAVVLTACTSSNGPGSPPSTATTPPGPTAATCPASAAFGDGGNVGGSSAAVGMEVRSLFFQREGRLRPGVELKIVWRLTGGGEPVFSASTADGATVGPVWGPEPHTGSTWNVPGDEYGTGWTFPTAGCWTIHVARDGGAYGELALRVA
jgi:hypothetical protein